MEIAMVQDYLSTLIDRSINVVTAHGASTATLKKFKSCLRKFYLYCTDKSICPDIKTVTTYFESQFKQKFNSHCLSWTARFTKRALSILLAVNIGDEEISKFFRPPIKFTKEILPDLDVFFEKETLSCCQKVVVRKKRALIRYNNFLYEKNIKPENFSLNILSQFLASTNIPISQVCVTVHTIRRYYKFLYDQQKFRADLSPFFPRIPNTKRRVISTLTKEEINQILGSIDRTSQRGKRDYLIILLFAMYGLRTKDIVNLKINNFNISQQKIILKTTKTNTVIELKLTNRVINALKDYLVNVRALNPSGEYLFIRIRDKNHKKPLSTDGIRCIIARYYRLAGISSNRRVGGHSFRHAVATNMANTKIPLPVIKEILGHASVTMSGYYIENSIEDLRSGTLALPKINSEIYLYGI